MSLIILPFDIVHLVRHNATVLSISYKERTMQKFTRATPTNVRHALEKAHGKISQGEGSAEPEALARLASLLGTKAHKHFCEQAEPVLMRMARKNEVKLKHVNGKISEIKLVGYKPPKEHPAKKGAKPPREPKVERTMTVREEFREAGEYVPDSELEEQKEPAELLSQTEILMVANGRPVKAKSRRSRNTSAKLTHFR